MRAYSVYDRCPNDGAALVFANTAKEARRLGYPIVRSWFDSEWIDVRARWIRNPPDTLLQDCRGDEPHAIESPSVACDQCERWGGRMNKLRPHLCEDCVQFQRDCDPNYTLYLMECLSIDESIRVTRWLVPAVRNHRVAKETI